MGRRQGGASTLWGLNVQQRRGEHGQGWTRGRDIDYTGMEDFLRSSQRDSWVNRWVSSTQKRTTGQFTIMLGGLRKFWKKEEPRGTLYLGGGGLGVGNAERKKGRHQQGVAAGSRWKVQGTRSR